MTTVSQYNWDTLNLAKSIHALTVVLAAKRGLIWLNQSTRSRLSLLSNAVLVLRLGVATIPILLITTSGADPGKEMEELAEKTVGRGRYGPNFRTRNTSKNRRICLSSHQRLYCTDFEEGRIDVRDTTG